MAEKTVSVKGFVLGALAVGFMCGLAVASLLFTIGYRGEHQRFGKHLEQVNIDLDRTRTAQRDAAERARRLQEELAGITEYARNLEEGTRRASFRAGELTERLDGIIERSGELEHGIERAQTSLDDSRNLLGELGTLLLGLQTSSGTENPKP